MPVAKDRHFEFLSEQIRGAGWLMQDALAAYTGEVPIFFDSATQIVMPQWHKGRVALIGDACGCLTLLAGQGSHMAMAGGYVLAQELARQPDHAAAFAAYQSFLKPPVDKKQKRCRAFRRPVRAVGALASLAAAFDYCVCCSAARSFALGLAFFGANSVIAGRA